MNCIAIGCGGDGMFFTKGLPVNIANCILEGNGGYGINATGAAIPQQIVSINNAFFGNTSGEIATGWTEILEPHGRISLKGSAFIDPTNVDFRISGHAHRGVAPKWPVEFLVSKGTVAATSGGGTSGSGGGRGGFGGDT